MRVLVVFFANSGHTRYVASEIARRCGAEMEEILDARPHAGACEALRYIRDSLIGATPPIEAALKDPADFDLVILGTPVWAWRVASPMRSYVRHNAQRFKQVAFFCTEGGVGDQLVFTEFGHLCGRTPIATYQVIEPYLSEPIQQAPLLEFMARLKTT
ncbi:MAG: flavodoxin [Burkholderiaceae bacterium]|nr:flavodoxin [Burkholderiaceae bacterium]